MTKIIDTDTYCYDNVFIIDWTGDDGYFGQIRFKEDEDGKMVIDSETMGSDFVKSVLNKMVDMSRFVE